MPAVNISDTNLNTARLKVSWRRNLSSQTKHTLMGIRQVVKMWMNMDRYRVGSTVFVIARAPSFGFLWKGNFWKRWCTFCQNLKQRLCGVWVCERACAWTWRSQFSRFHSVVGIWMKVCGWRSGEKTPTRENRSTMRKIYSNATLSITNPTRTGRELNPIICGGRSATNHLNYDRSNDTVTVFMFEISHGSGCRITVF